MDSARLRKVVTASALKAMPHVKVSVRPDKALPVRDKVLLPARRCVMAASVHRKADGKLKASARPNAVPRVIARWNRVAKVKAVHNARRWNASNLC